MSSDLEKIPEKLKEIHKRGFSDFDCGHKEINAFAKNDIFKYQQQNIGVSYVILDEKGDVSSFVTLLMGAIKIPDTPSLTFKLNMPSVEGEIKQLPALKIGKLGTRKGDQRKGNAKRLIEFAIFKAMTMRNEIGCLCLTLDAFESNIAIYKKCGFDCAKTEITGETMPMFMKLLP